MVTIPKEELRMLLDKVGGQAAASRLLGIPTATTCRCVRVGRFRASLLARIREVIAEGKCTPRIRSYGEHLPWPRQAEDGTELGIDVTKHMEEIVSAIRTAKKPIHLTWIEFDSEVFSAILNKNRMRSAFDPRRGSLRGYVVSVAWTTAKNLKRSYKRYTRRTAAFSERLERLIYA